MSGSVQQRLHAISGKAHLLVSRYDTLLQAKAQADARIAELEAELKEQKLLNERLAAAGLPPRA